MNRLPWETLERWGITLQVLKIGLASGCAWALAVWLFHSEKPYFAPMAAILCLQVTVAESVSRGIQRIMGVVGGILMALLFTNVVGVHAWSIGLVVIVAMVAGSWFRLGPQGIPQVAISALLVMTIGSSVSGYALFRILDTMLGAVVAILVNALIIPPDFTRQAENSLEMLAHAVSEVLAGIRLDLLAGLDPQEASYHLKRARAIDRALHDARVAIRRAEESLKWNYLMRQRKSRLERLRSAVSVLEHSVSQVRGIARTLFLTLHRDVGRPLSALPGLVAIDMADLLYTIHQALMSYARLIKSRDPDAASALDDHLADAAQKRTRLVSRAGELLLKDQAASFLDIASVVSDLEKMGEDLSVSARVLIPVIIPS